MIRKDKLFSALINHHKRGVITTAEYYNHVVQINTAYGQDFDLPSAMQI